MKRELGRKLRAQFLRKMMSEFPLYDPACDEGIPSDCLLFQRRVSETLSTFVMLQPHHQRDNFYVEVAASVDHRWPAYDMPVDPRDLKFNGRVRVRLSRFFRHGGIDLGWSLESNETEGGSYASGLDSAEESEMRRISDLVEEAFAALRKWGMPFLEGLSNDGGENKATRRGIPGQSK